MLSLNNGKFSRIVARFDYLRAEARTLAAAMDSRSVPRNNKNRSKLRKLHSDALLAFLALLRELAKDCKTSTDSRNSLKATIQTVQSGLTISEVSAYCETYKTGGMFGQTAYDNPKDLLGSLKLSTPNLTADKLRAIVETIERHNGEVSELRTVAEWIDRSRKDLLEIEPENSVQADCLSLLLATIPQNTWNRSQCHINHYCGLHGGSLEYLERIKAFPRCNGKRGILGGRATRARGIRVLKSWGGLYRKLATSYGSDSYGILRRKQYLSALFLRDAHYRNSGPLAELYHTIGELLQGTTLLTVCQYAVDSLASERHLFEYRNLKAVEYYIPALRWIPAAEASDRIRACERLVGRNRLSLPGIDYQAVVSRPEYVQDLELLGPDFAENTVPEKTELRLKMENEDPAENERVYSLPLYRCLTLSVQGFSWEYYVGKPSHPAVPGRLIEACRYAGGYHIVPDPIEGESAAEYWSRCPDVGIVVEKLVLRINTELRQRKHIYRVKPGKVSTIDYRKFAAAILRTLRNTETISIQDSTKIGNCEFGSREFAQRLGIRDSSVSGRILARHWRAANYPQNTLFFRVVQSLPAYSTIVESGVAQ